MDQIDSMDSKLEVDKEPILDAVEHHREDKEHILAREEGHRRQRCGARKWVEERPEQ